MRPIAFILGIVGGFGFLLLFIGFLCLWTPVDKDVKGSLRVITTGAVLVVTSLGAFGYR
jgi:hypothetical protein